jgi:hypothetical protein
LYYKENYGAYIKTFDRSKLVKLEERWNDNVQQLLDIISIYVKDQEEFDDWIKVINTAHQEYFTMINQFPSAWESFKRKCPTTELDAEKKKINDILLMRDRIKYMNEYTKAEKKVGEAEWTL